MIGTTLGHYQVVEKIGRGGMGVVYRARDTRLDRDVALKVLADGILADRAAHRRFRNEAKALSRLSHPNVAVVYDFDSREDLDFLVLELIPGESLADRLARGALSEAETVSLGYQIVDGLAAAHEQDVIHRDIKPANLFVLPDGRLKILDFGLARVVRELSESGASTRITGSEHAHGTLQYMAPEQLRGEKPDRRSDLYSVGVVLFEMATGRHLVRETTLPELVDQVLAGMTVPPREVNPAISPELDRIVVKSLAGDPDARFQSAAELRGALAALGSPPTPVPPSPSARGRGRGRGGARVAGGILGIAGVLAGMVWLWNRIPPPDSPDIAPIRSLVVLPFENLSGPDQQFLADGMTDVLIMDLARTGALRVISRTSAMHYAGTDKLLPQIAEELGVEAAVEGSILCSEERVRITVRLVHAREDRSVWSDHYERDLIDVLRLQRDVARDVARNVEVAVSRETGRETPVRPSAYEAYLRGRHYLGRRAPDAFGTAIRHFERAVEEDPSFAAAHAELANCYLLLGSIGYDVLSPAEAIERARASAEAALELDERSAAAWTAMAHIHHNADWDWPGAEAGYRRAIELNPGYATAHQWYGFYLASRGRLEEAVAAQEAALEIDPLSPLIHASLGRLHYYRRDHEAASSHFERALELEPWSLPAILVYGMLRLDAGRLEEARALFETGREISKGAPAFLAGVGACHGVAGDEPAARAVIAELAELAGSRYVPAFYPAAIRATLGDVAEALDGLERAYEERSEAVLYLGVEPLVDGLREEPRFRSITSRVGANPG